MTIPFLPTAKDVLVKPEAFFDERVKKIRRWREPITYLLFFGIIISFFSSNSFRQFFAKLSQKIFEEFGVQDIMPRFTPTAWSIALLFLALILIFMLSSSLKYWIVHLYVRAWNKKAEFKKTFAVLTYGGTPGWLGMPFFLLTFHFLFQAITQRGTINTLLTILAGTLWLLLEGYGIYLRVYALARLQRITRMQAILSIYLFGLPTYIIGIFIIEIILLTPVAIILSLA